MSIYGFAINESVISLGMSTAIGRNNKTPCFDLVVVGVLCSNFLVCYSCLQVSATVLAKSGTFAFLLSQQHFCIGVVSYSHARFGISVGAVFLCAAFAVLFFREFVSRFSLTVLGAALIRA